MSCYRLCSRQLQDLVKTFCLRKDLTVGPSTAKMFYTARNYLAGKIPGELVFAVDKWPDYSAVMCAAGEGTLQHLQEIESYTFCWENGDGLLKLLRDDKLVDWSKNFTIAAFSEKGVPALRQVCREMGKQVPSPDNMTQVRTAFKTDMMPENDMYSLPDPSLTIGRLERHHAELVNRTWVWGGPPKVLEFIQYVLATFPSRCVYDKQGEPLAFLIVQPWGELGMMRTSVPRAGYAAGILHSLINDTLEKGDLPYGYAESGNEIPIKMFDRIGAKWDPSGSCYWIYM
ncbi:glycine N-acyltransferase-like [Branchiostoma floridae x Branchiostoma japonicum]